MKEQYWEQFVMTGKVEDYLAYKGIAICQDIMKKYEDQKNESVGYGDRNGFVGDTDRRI